jgi:hypothetical protein
MRKATLAVAVILLLSMLGMMFAANTLLGSVQRDVDLGKNLTRYFDSRGALAPGTKVTALHSGPTPRRLATEGNGLVLEVTPSDDVRKGRTGLADLVGLLVRTALDEGGPNRVSWVEVAIHLDPDKDAAPFRTLIPVASAGEIGDPTPPLPAAPPGKAPLPNAPASTPRAPAGAPAAGTPAGTAPTADPAPAK